TCADVSVNACPDPVVDADVCVADAGEDGAVAAVCDAVGCVGASCVVDTTSSCFKTATSVVTTPTAPVGVAELEPILAGAIAVDASMCTLAVGKLGSAGDDDSGPPSSNPIICLAAISSVLTAEIGSTFNAAARMVSEVAMVGCMGTFGNVARTGLLTSFVPSRLKACAGSAAALCGAMASSCSTSSAVLSEAASIA